MADQRALREANEGFYDAVESLDIVRMERIWLRQGCVRCVHPGWDVLVGWDAVRHSWEQIFAGTSWIRVTPTDVAVVVIGDMGVVACSESISTTREGDVGVAAAVATNLFRRTPEGWRIFLHHASPSPLQLSGASRGSA